MSYNESNMRANNKLVQSITTHVSIVFI